MPLFKDKDTALEAFGITVVFFAVVGACTVFGAIGWAVYKAVTLLLN